jgi:uncharacterized lipoprotein YbaY
MSMLEPRVTDCSGCKNRDPKTACVSETTSKEEEMMSSSEAPLVKGEILFEDVQRSFEGATVRVRLEDVSYADAPSRVVAEQVIPDVSCEAGTDCTLRFGLYGDVPDERRRYVVTVYVDLHGQGRVTQGDYLSMESQPVLTHGNPDQISVRVREVS